jgi:hypothetical protein
MDNCTFLTPKSAAFPGNWARVGASGPALHLLRVGEGHIEKG